MALTSRDENDLLLPLLTGTNEQPAFSTFLHRLGRRASVVSVSITIRPGEGREAVNLFAGPNLRQRAYELKLEELNLTDRIHYDRLRPGRVYSGDEFDDHDPVRKAQRTRDMRKLGLADERVVRLLDEDGTSAWLIIASERPCTAAHSALLSSLAPYAAAAIRSFVAAEQRKLADALNDEGLHRSGSGWIVFDEASRVLAFAPVIKAVLAREFGHPPATGQRLRELGPAVERALSNAATSFARAPGAEERAIVLLHQPRIEAILSPAPRAAGTLIDKPAMVATCRQARMASPGRATHLASLYALPPREAELAILLADGLSLVEASGKMRLTIETTRNYSKRLFAKMGVRGQAELVKAVYDSCAMLA